MKRRIPKDAKLEYAERAVEFGTSKKRPKDLQKKWISQAKRRTHKRERREAKKDIDNG